jgi:hypothetical protein
MDKDLLWMRRPSSSLAITVAIMVTLADNSIIASLTYKAKEEH